MENNINIVMPMAGLGTRFANEGFSLPKPLIETNGKTRQIILFNSKHRKRKCNAISGRPLLHQSV